MTHTGARRSATLPLFALLALAGGLRAGLAAPVTAPLPPSCAQPLAAAAEPVDTAGLAHASFAVG